MIISRSTSRLLAKIYTSFFTLKSRHRISYSGQRDTYYEIDDDILYDFLYERDYATWFLNIIEQQRFTYPRRLEEFIMKINTGESLLAGTASWTFEQREKLGQRYLKDLAEDMIEYCDTHDVSSEKKRQIAELKSKLELDGFIWNPETKKLLFSEEAVLDVKEEQGVLAALVDQLALANRETILHHLGLSEEHYVNDKWDDSISQSRKFLESILQKVAARHHEKALGRTLPRETYEQPKEIRGYLEKNGLIESKEREAIAKIYGLLSDTGGHPYIAEKDQARLMRHLALTFSQFVMLRLDGYFRSQNK
jgi:hypothetical protein